MLGVKVAVVVSGSGNMGRQVMQAVAAADGLDLAGVLEKFSDGDRFTPPDGNDVPLGQAVAALGADLRYARPDARLSIMEIKWGIIPDMAITTTLCRIMPADKIKELAWSGRVVDGREGLSLGLVTALHDDPSQAARDTARLIASKSPDAIRAIKRLFDRAWNLADADALKLEAGLQMSLLGGENQIEAVMANVDARTPEFTHPKR